MLHPVDPTYNASRPRLADARLAVSEYIEGWYNPHRRHSALAYLSPLQYETRHPPRSGAPATLGVPEVTL